MSPQSETPFTAMISGANYRGDTTDNVPLIVMSTDDSVQET